MCYACYWVSGDVDLPCWKNISCQWLFSLLMFLLLLVGTEVNGMSHYYD